MVSITKVRILKSSKEVVPYVAKVQSLADSNKSALGFLPRSVFHEQALRSRLWVAMIEGPEKCLGYLLFGGRFPSLRIFQVFVTPESQKRGIASNLVSQLIKYGEANNYLSISARVAADLLANRFWEKAGFHLARQDFSRGASGRTINVFSRALDTPSLLKMMAYDLPIPSTKVQDIHFLKRPVSKSPIYVLDLNIFFDVVRNRLHRKEAAFMIRAGLAHMIRVCVTPEFAKELEKHTKPGQSDPILEFAKEIPALPKLGSADLERLLSELQAIVFPLRSTQSKKADRDRSDLAHLAYCIHHRATGFITREKAVLAASNQLQENYCLEILSPADLFQPALLPHDTPPSIRVSFGTQRLRIGAANENEREEVEQLLLRLGVNMEILQAVWDPGVTGSLRRRITIRSDGKLLGVASWEKASRFRHTVLLYLYVDEQDPQAERAIDHILETVLRDCQSYDPRIIILETSVEQTQTRVTALQRGFVKSFADSSNVVATTLLKFALRGIITKENWEELRREFENLTGLRLPSRIPSIEEFENTGITIQDQAGKPISRLKLFEFETLLSPSLVLCSGRSGLILPIRAHYAKELFEDVHHQMDIFPSPEAKLHVEKAYFRNPRNVRLFNRGIPVLFYVSGSGGGTKEVIGCARITYSEILPLENVELALRRQGVLDPQTLSGFSDASNNIHAFTFDNFNLYPHRIPFQHLRKHNIISGANLVTVEKLSPDRLVRVCRWGFGLEEMR